MAGNVSLHHAIVTQTEFLDVVRALRQAATRAGRVAATVELAEGGRAAGILMTSGSWFVVEREHLDCLDGNSADIAAAVYAVYEEGTGTAGARP